MAAGHRESPTSYTVEAPADHDAPYWLVLGQSHNAGWHLTADGEDLGKPMLVGGFANGWRIDPADHDPDAVLALNWEPQRVVWWALALSALGFIASCGLALRRPADPAKRSAPMRP